MIIIPGIIQKGKAQLDQSIPAEDGTSVLVLVMPGIPKINSEQNLFGKWDWYNDEIENELKNAWQN